MSGALRDQALQHLRKAESQIERGDYGDALLTLEKAGQFVNEAQAPDISSIVIGTAGRVMQLAGRYDEALKNHMIALNIQEKLAEHEPFFNTWVATTLNNLGALLSDMGRIDEARARYEGALEMYERLLEGDHENVTYQSDVAMTLNNLGNLLSRMGRIDEARERYEQSLDIYTEPMQYVTIQTKSRTIINIIQLISRSAEEETNRLRKQEHFREVYAVYNRHKAFFTRYNLEYEHQLVREAGLGAHIQYLMLNAEAETDDGKRTDEYAKCVQEVRKITETEDDEGLRELLLSVMHYFEGRRLINEAIKFESPDKEFTEKAVEEFKRAKDRYKHANVCYCIYTVLLELESVEVLDDAAVTRLKGLLHTAIDSLPEKMDETIKSAFGEIELLLEVGCVKIDPDMFIKLNRCITKIDYYALGAYFTHVSEKIASYLKEPFRPEVDYSDWTLKITFPEPDKVTGKLTINAGDDTLFDRPLGGLDVLHEKRRPRVKREVVTFTDGTGKTVTRSINYYDEIECDDGYVKVHILEHDCRRGIASNYFNIAIVQLKYHLYKDGSAIKVSCDEQYLNKIRLILDAVKKEADLIVFPEFSIPFDYLPEFKQYSDDNGIAIIAGSHYVTDANLDKYGDLFDLGFGEFGEKDLLKNISPVVIPSSEKIPHTEKVFGAKVERTSFFDEGMTHGTLNRIFKLRDDVTCGVMICFDFLNDDLRQRITDACNIIVVPQSNPEPRRFHGAGKMEIDNPRGGGNKAYIMASGIFTFYDGETNDGKTISGGGSRVIQTLDKDSHKKQEKREEQEKQKEAKIKEQFVLLSSLNMNFFAARDTQQAQTPIREKFIPIFEEDEIISSKKNKPHDFLDLLKKIESCEDRGELKELLEDNESLIQEYSPLMHAHTKNLKDMRLDQLKNKCRVIVV